MFNFKRLDAKLVILPGWVDDALTSFDKSPLIMEDENNWASILSPEDIKFYRTQIANLVHSTTQNKNNNPLLSLFRSVEIVGLDIPLSEEPTPMEKPTISYSEIPLVNIDCTAYLPRYCNAKGNGLFLKLEYIGKELFVLRFMDFVPSFDDFEKHDPYPLLCQAFIKNSILQLIKRFHFDEICKTALFDFYSQVPLEIDLGFKLRELN